MATLYRGLKDCHIFVYVEKAIIDHNVYQQKIKTQYDYILVSDYEMHFSLSRDILRVPKYYL